MSALAHLTYACIIVLLLAALVVAWVSRLEYKRMWLADERWINAHYVGAGVSEYDAVREGDVRHPIGGRR